MQGQLIQAVVVEVLQHLLLLVLLVDQEVLAVQESL
jgi:hypothetical protein